MFDKIIRIGDKEIGMENPVFIIAEAGVNHNGSFDLALKLIDKAAEAEVDAVKFQSFKTENLILNHIEKAPYQKETSGENETQFSMLKRLEMSIEQIKKLKQYAEKKGLIFLSTPFDEESMEELNEIDIDAFKIASTDTTNISFLRKAAKKGKPILLSTGMCDLDELDQAVKEIEKYNPQLVLLQCTANYPIKDEDANLNIIPMFQKRYKVITGYSDHSVGVGAAPYAVPLGAKIIEKHFTLDKNMEGPDHKASLEPEELKALVLQIRKAEKYCGIMQEKDLTLEEKETKKALQKCIVASKKIEQGEPFSEKNLACKRTGGVGIGARFFDSLLGKESKGDYQMNEIISEEEL